MSYIFLGFSLGLSAGLAPGPLLALVMQRSLQYGVASGVRIAFAPLLTDLPIVILALLFISRLPQIYLHGLMAAGGLFVLWLALDAWRTTHRTLDTPSQPDAHQDLVRGMIVNLLNPHPYIFWGAIGAPLVVRAWNENPWYAVGFILVFYLLLIGGKAVLALVLGRLRGMPTAIHQRLMQISAVLLFVAGSMMLHSAWQGIVTSR